MGIGEVCFDHQFIIGVLVCHVVFEGDHHDPVVLGVHRVQVVGHPVHGQPVHGSGSPGVQRLGGGGAIDQHQPLQSLLALLAPVQRLMAVVEGESPELPRRVWSADVTDGHVSTGDPLIGVTLNPDNACFPIDQRTHGPH